MAITYFPAFGDGDVELRYQHNLAPHQIRGDFRTAVIGVMMQSVVVAKAGSKAHLPAVYSLMAVFFCLLPILTILLNRQDYMELRNRILAVWLVFVWYYGAQSSALAEDLPPTNILLFILRSQVLQMVWANVSVRLPFHLHVPVHAGVVMAIFVSNHNYCRFTGTMRHILKVKSPDAGSFSASGDGMCVVTTGFFQIVVGYLLPCYITLLIELRSRHEFLCEHIRWRASRELVEGEEPPLPQTWRPRPGWMLTWHLVWLGTLATIISWWVAEAMAVNFPMV